MGLNKLKFILWNIALTINIFVIFYAIIIFLNADNPLGKVILGILITLNISSGINNYPKKIEYYFDKIKK